MAKLELKGFENLELKLDKLENIDIRSCLNSAGLLVESEAKVLCPVDTGRLRASLNYQVYDNYCLVGSNVEYAPYVEYGTGLFSS